MRKLSFQKVIGLVLTSIVITAFLSYVAFSPDLSYNTVLEQGSLNTEFDFVVFNETTTFYARNGQTGAIDYEGTNKSVVVQSCIDALDMGIICLKNMRKPDYITLTSTTAIMEYYQGRIRHYTEHGLMFTDTQSRNTANGLCSFDDEGYYSCRKGAVLNEYISMWNVGESFGFGVYQAVVKVDMITHGTMHIFGFERHHGFAGEGLIWFEAEDGSTYSCNSRTPGGTESNNIAGVNMTFPTTLKIDWSAANIKFYVNGTLKFTHSTYIPQNPMMWYIEAYTGGDAPADFFGCWQTDFMELEG